MPHNLTSLLGKLGDGKSLTQEEAQSAFLSVMQGDATQAQIGALLTALRMKGESVQEIAGATQVMRQLSTKVTVDLPNLLDTCGTGGSGKNKLFNISTAAAFVASAAGVNIAKHGNRAASSKSGSADVLELGGVNIHLTPQQIEQCIQEIGIGFMFAQAHHSAMRHAMPARRELGFRTIFNLVGPLSNPAAAPNQVVGVFSEEWQSPMVEVLHMLGSNRVMSVHSQGLDELSVGGPSRVVELIEGEQREYTLNATDMGLQRHDLDTLKAGSIDASLALIKSAISGKNIAARDIVALNAGASIYVAGLADDIKLGVEQALELIASGKAMDKWNALAQLSSNMVTAQTNKA